MSDVRSLLNQLAKAIDDQTLKIELHHYHHYPDGKKQSDYRIPLDAVDDSMMDTMLAKKTETETDNVREHLTTELKKQVHKTSPLPTYAEEKEFLSKLTGECDPTKLSTLLTERESLFRKLNVNASGPRQVSKKLLQLAGIPKPYHEQVEKAAYFVCKTVPAGEDVAKHVPTLRKILDDPQPHEGELMSSKELTDVLDDVMTGGFDMNSYIEEKRKKGNEVAKQFASKKSSRKNNVEDVEIMEKFFNQEMGEPKKKEPEPPTINPLMRYRKEDQQKIQMRIFKEAKQFVMECHPGKTSDQLEKEIMEESDKRFEAWCESHYKK